MKRTDPGQHVATQVRTLDISLAFCLILLALLLAGCSKPALDKSLLTNDPCAPPCWSGLVPGKSTEEDVRRELKNSPWVKRGSVGITSTKVSGVPILDFTWDDRERQGASYNRARVRDGYLVHILVNLDYELTFEEVIGLFGPPEGVYAYVIEKDYRLYTVSLDYPPEGLSFVMQGLDFTIEETYAGEGLGILSPDFLVTEVHYYAPNSLKGALRDTFMMTPDNIERRSRYEQPWEGFGKVELAPQ